MTLLLGIETSCDETSAAVVADGTVVRSNVIATQDDLHRRYAGVVPEIASRAHLERILPVVEQALAEAGASLRDLDAIAVGHRPGLVGSLLVGTSAAKALAWALDRPLIGVDHVHAHLWAGNLGREPAALPALGLVVSGGHTSLYRVEAPFDCRTIGRTIDDAVGEAYDKAATIIGLPWPGGPRLDALATEGDDRAHDFPIARVSGGGLDFSFSGLKTAFLYAARGQPKGRDATGPRFPRDGAALDDDAKADLAASFQRAAVRAVMRNVIRAVDEEPERRSLLVGGGVSANRRLRAELESLAKRRSLDLRLPELRHCLDNAAMIAGLGAVRLAAGDVDGLDLQAATTTLA